VALLREEFRIPKSTFYSDLWRRAVSRLARPSTSSCYCLTVTVCQNDLIYEIISSLLKEVKYLSSSVISALASLHVYGPLCGFLSVITMSNVVSYCDITSLEMSDLLSTFVYHRANDIIR